MAMLPEFRKAVAGTRAAVKKLDRAVEKVRTYGYPRTTTRRSRRSNPETPSGVPQGGQLGGESPTGTQ